MAANTFYPILRQPRPDNPDDFPKVLPVMPISNVTPTLSPELLTKLNPYYSSSTAQKNSADSPDLLGSGSGNMAPPYWPLVNHSPAPPEPNMKHVDKIVDRVVKQLIIIFLLTVVAVGSLTFAFFRLREYPLEQYKQAWNELVDE